MREESSENRTWLFSRSGPESLTKILLLYILTFLSVQQFVSFSCSFIYLTWLFYKYLFLIKLVVSVSELFRTIMCFDFFFKITFTKQKPEILFCSYTHRSYDICTLCSINNTSLLKISVLLIYNFSCWDLRMLILHWL